MGFFGRQNRYKEYIDALEDGLVQFAALTHGMDWIF